MSFKAHPFPSSYFCQDSCNLSLPPPPCTGKQLLSAFVPLVLKICNNPGVYSDPALSAAAALALGKFCMVRYLPCLTVLWRTSHIAFSLASRLDLSVAFTAVPKIIIFKSFCGSISLSSDLCDAHLRLLFTMMEKSTLPTVRANLMIAAGDLAIRFPNLVEPWTPHLYAR